MKTLRVASEIDILIDLMKEMKQFMAPKIYSFDPDENDMIREAYLGNFDRIIEILKEKQNADGEKDEEKAEPTGASSTGHTE